MLFRARSGPQGRPRLRRSLHPRLEALEIRLVPSATHLVVTTEPTTVTAGQAFELSVSAEDDSGNVDPSFNGNVTVSGAINSNSPSTVNAVNGVATFSRLSMDAAGSWPLFLTDPSGVLGATATDLIAVTAAPATRLVVTSPPPDAVTAGSPFGLVIAAGDQYGNVDSSFSGNVTVALANNPGGSTLAGTANVSFSNGLAVFSGLTLNKAGTGYTLLAASSGLAPSTSLFDVTPGSATQLMVTSSPPSSVTAGSPFGLVLAAEDSLENVDPTFTGSVTVALANNPGGSTLGGVTNVTFSNGLAAFSGLTLNESGTGYTLLAASSGLTPPSSLISSSIAVTAAAPSQLVVTSSPPAIVAAGQAFSFTVAVEDPFGNLATGFSGSLAVAPTDGQMEGNLGGGLTAPVAQGLASFAGLSLYKSGTPFTLQVSTTGLPSVTTSPFTVTAAQATRLVVITPPPAAVTAGAGFGLQVAAEDPYGNVDTAFAGTVIVGLAPGSAQNTLAGTTILPFSSGLATFAGLTLTRAGSGDLLQATSSGLTPAAPSTLALSVTAGPAVQLVPVSPPPANVTAGVPFGLVLAAEDLYGNLAPAFTGNVTVGLANNPGAATLGGASNVAFSNGFASVSGLTLNQSGTGYTLLAASTGLAPAIPPGSLTFNVTAAAAAQLVVTTQPPATVTAGQGFPLTVAIEDQYGNVATGFSGNAAVTPTGGQAEGSLGGPLTVPVVGGVATFAGLSLYGTGAAFTLQVSTTGLPAVTTSPFSVAAGQATQLVMTASPPAAVTVGVGFGLTVAAEDPFGNVNPNFTGGVSVAIASNLAGGNLGGGITVAAVGGVATFAGLTLDTVSSGYTLEVTSGALTPATTGSINVVIPGTITSGGGSSGTTASGGGSSGSTASGGATVGPVHLAVSAHPDTVTAGRYFQITIAAEDSLGAIDSGFSGRVTLALASNPGHATLGGNLNMPMNHGTLTFYGLTLDTAGSGYTIRATASGSAPAIAPPITVINPAARIDVTGPPPSTIVIGASFGLTIRVEDAFGVRSPGYNGSVTVALAGKHGRGKLRGPLTVNAVDGVATFSGLMLPRAHKGQTFQIQVTASGLAPATTSPITVLPAPARAPHPFRGKHTRLRALRRSVVRVRRTPNEA